MTRLTAMRFARFLLVLSFLAAPSGAQQQKYTLKGQIHAAPPSPVQATAQAQIPLFHMTARLYFPKAAKRSALLAYADAEGRFQFVNLDGGGYLLEIYLGDKLLYQKVVELRSNQNLDIILGDILVANRAKLEQRHRRILLDPEFGGNVTVYVGDVHKSKPFTLTVFQTGAEKSRWRDDSKIASDALHSAVPKTRRLFEGLLDPRTRRDAEFTYSGQKYALVWSTEAHRMTTDYFYFEVYRRTGGAQPQPNSTRK